MSWPLNHEATLQLARPLNVARQGLITKVELLYVMGFLKFSQVEETTVEKMDNRKTTSRNNVFLGNSNGAPIQNDWSTDLNKKEKRTPRCALTMFCLLSNSSMQQFLRYACGIKQVYVIINTMLTIQWCQVDDIRHCINRCDPHCDLITQFDYEFTLTKCVFCHLLALMCSMWSIEEGLQFSC